MVQETAVKQIDFALEANTRKSKVKKTVNLLTIVGIMVTAVLIGYFSYTFKYQMLILRRGEYVEAALRVDEQKTAEIDKKVADIRQDGLKQLLSPLVVADLK